MDRLVCAVFLLLFCLTGLPLIFKHELRELLSEAPPDAMLPPDTPRADLDGIITLARPAVRRMLEREQNVLVAAA